jgi:hypothetical protein
MNGAACSPAEKRGLEALQRPVKYANQEFFTEAQRTELDQVRSGILKAGLLPCRTWWPDRSTF